MNSSDRFCEVWVLDPKEERHQLKVFSQIHFLEEKQIEIMFGEKKKVMTATLRMESLLIEKKVNLCMFNFRRSFQ